MDLKPYQTCQICPHRASGGNPALCRKHRKEYAAATQGYKMKSVKVERQKELVKNTAAETTARIDEEMAQRRQYIRTLDEEISSRRAHHKTYFGQEDDGHAHWLQNLVREREDSNEHLRKLQKIRNETRRTRNAHGARSLYDHDGRPSAARDTDQCQAWFTPHQRCIAAVLASGETGRYCAKHEDEYHDSFDSWIGVFVAEMDLRTLVNRIESWEGVSTADVQRDIKADEDVVNQYISLLDEQAAIEDTFRRRFRGQGSFRPDSADVDGLRTKASTLLQRLRERLAEKNAAMAVRTDASSSTLLLGAALLAISSFLGFSHLGSRSKR